MLKIVLIVFGLLIGMSRLRVWWALPLLLWGAALLTILSKCLAFNGEWLPRLGSPNWSEVPEAIFWSFINASLAYALGCIAWLFASRRGWNAKKGGS